jgi:hypothetical protein
VSSESNIGSAVWRGGRAGAIAASAVTGALLGFGLRGGMAARPVNAAASALLGDRARGVWGFVAGVSAAGELVIVASCVLAGALCAALLQLVPAGSRVRHPRLFAFVFALVAAVAMLLLLVARAPEFVATSSGGALSMSEGIVLALLVSGAYASGMGLAR